MHKRMQNDERSVEEYLRIWDDYKVHKNKVKQSGMLRQSMRRNK